MTEKNQISRLDRIVAAAEDHFKMPVRDTDAPGGSGRSSFRLHFDDLSVIGTLRPNFRRTHLEAFVLSELRPYNDDIPRCLGVVGEILFQSDVGARRLNVEIAKVGMKDRVALADEAVAAIFRIQSAARRANLTRIMPHLGANETWLSGVVNSVKTLEVYGPAISRDYDRRAAADRLNAPTRQFVKWDCRSGNAALDDDGKLRWFDFEYAGLRHGAEDIAWLIGDEAWPIGPDVMLQIVIDNFDAGCGHTLDDYLDFLSIYLVFHCIQRLKLIVKEARSRGWISKHKARTYDDAGVHPDFAAHLCDVGAFFADRSPVTAPLVRNFVAAQATFAGMVRDADAAIAQKACKKAASARTGAGRA